MIKPENYYVVQGWMITDLKLSGISLQVYAIIHGFSQDDKSVFNGGKQYLMDWTGYKRRQITSVLQDLTKQGLLECIKGEVHGHDGYVYRTSAKFAPVQNLHQCNNCTSAKNTLDTSAKFAPVTGAKNAPELVQNLHPSTPSQTYSPNDLPPAPYNKYINKSIKKENKKDDDAAPSFSSSRKPFNLSPTGNERPDLDLPCDDGVTMYFTDDDITDLQNAYIGVDVISEIRKMILQAKQIGKTFSLDRTRKRVYVWLGNTQNKIAADTTISHKVYHIDPAWAQPKKEKTTEEILAGFTNPAVRAHFEALLKEGTNND